MTIPIYVSINVGVEFGVLTLMCDLSEKVKVELVNYFISFSNVMLLDTDHEEGMTMLYPMGVHVYIDEGRCLDNDGEPAPDYFVFDGLKAIG